MTAIPHDQASTTEPVVFHPIADDAKAALFSSARTLRRFDDTPVTNEQLTEIWELARWAPTSSNTQPLRVVYVQSSAARSRLVPLMNEGNRPKTATAPATAILAVNLDFHEATIFEPEFAKKHVEVDKRHATARFSATLQAGYFILAIRAVGLGAGPMTGFNAEAVDSEFFSGTSLRSILIVNIGHPGENPWHPRAARLDTSDAITWL